MQVTQAYLRRIEAYDQKGPVLNTVITLNPKALDEARALDAERKAGKVRGPLHGIVVLAGIEAVGDPALRSIASAGVDQSEQGELQGGLTAIGADADDYRGVTAIVNLADAVFDSTNTHIPSSMAPQQPAMTTV